MEAIDRERRQRTALADLRRRASAHGRPGLVRDLPGEGACVAESASLADAIAQMARMHARFLAVTGGNERVVGVLGDLDALRWAATHRPDSP